MKYYIDTEFIEGSQKGWLGRDTKPTIDLISIGIVAEDGREYYAISKDFNLKEAWNRFDYKRKTVIDGIAGAYKDYWIRNNILKPIFAEWVTDDSHWTNKDRTHGRWQFTYDNFKWHLKINGKTNKQIAEEVIDFCSIGSVISNKGLNIRQYREYSSDVEDWINVETIENNKPINYNNKPTFYGYYCDYDWVVFCWLFGRMIDLPSGFPMYCIDLKQELDATVSQMKIRKYIRGTIKHDKLKEGIDYTDTVGKENMNAALHYVKAMKGYPKQTNKHNALADAKWNKQLHEFLNNLT